MIYRSFGKNSTGQVLVGCPHVSNVTSVEMEPVRKGMIYECAIFGRVLFMPSKKTIVFWCPDCYSALLDRERPEGHLEPFIEPVLHLSS